MDTYKQHNAGIHFYKIYDTGRCLHVAVDFNSWTINNLPKLPFDRGIVDCTKELFNEKLQRAIDELSLKEELLEPPQCTQREAVKPHFPFFNFK